MKTKPRQPKLPTAPRIAPALPEFTGLSNTSIIAELAKSPHGKLDVYLPLLEAAKQDPEFFAHLTTWNAAKGEVKDARVALPIISLREGSNRDFQENALANLAGLDLRLFTRALGFGHTLFSREWKLAKRLVTRRLRDLEADERQWNRVAIQHRASLHYLYRRYRVARPEFVARNIFEEEKGQRLLAIPGTVFHAVQQLPLVTPEEAAGLILRFKLPFLTVKGALGKKATSPEIAFALVGAMSPTELLHNTKDLEKNYNLKRDPALRAAYEKALEKAGAAKKGPSLKAQRAAEALEAVDEVLANKLKQAQEKRMEALSIEGNWLVLADRSPSMEIAIGAAIEVAGVLARAVKQNVHLVWFDAVPRYMNVTGKTYDEIRKLCANITPGGQGTSIGCGLDYALQSGFDIDGIAVVSDAQENTAPRFAERYQAYTKKFSKEPPVYLYRVSPNAHGYMDTDLAASMKNAGLTLTEFDLRGSQVDYYSLPNLVQTMRVNRYSLMDEILNMPLLTLNEVLTRTAGMEVIGNVRTAETI